MPDREVSHAPYDASFRGVIRTRNRLRLIDYVITVALKVAKHL